MNKKLPALILAVGMTAAPVFAKKANRKSSDDQYSKIEQNNNLKKNRIANSVKRLKQMEAEKEFIKETEQEITEALSGSEKQSLTNEDFFYTNTETSKVVIKDAMPINGIDISDQFRIIHKSETS